MKKFWVLVIGFTFVLSNFAFAEENYGFQGGETTVGVNASFSVSGSSNSDEDLSNFTGGLILTHFLNKNFEFGANVLGSMSSSGDTDTGMLFGDFILNYNFSTSSKWVPYIGAAAGGVLVAMDDNSEGYGTLGGQAGFKIFASENIYWTIELRHRTIFIEEETAYNNGIFFGLNAIF